MIRGMMGQPMNLRQKLWRGTVWSVAAIGVIGAFTFVVDYAVFRLRIWTGGAALGSVVVRHYYAVPQKNGKTEFIFDPPQPWTCVHSLFPHGGNLPCWYLTRHPEQRTDM